MSTVTEYEPRTYRGADLEELLPKIREELGPDAIVVRQREGLGGGVAGFFQRPCVEVVARRGRPSLDAYDERPAAAPPPAPEPSAPAIREIMRIASPFVEQLQAAEVAAASFFAPEPEPEPAAPRQVIDEHLVTGAYGTAAYAVADGTTPLNGRAWEPALPAGETAGGDRSEPTPAHPAERAPARPVAVAVAPAVAPQPAERGRAAAAHELALIDAGLAPRLVAELIDATISHIVPFGPKRALKHVVRDALARRIPLPPAATPGAKAIAFVGAGGSGKTLCAARMATAYARSSDLAVAVMSFGNHARRAALGELLDPTVEVLDARAAGPHFAFGDGVLTVIDTPAVSPAAAGEVRALAAALKRLGRPEVHVVVPATLSSVAVRGLLDGLAALRPTAIVLTHLDEVVHPGSVIDEAIMRAIPISYTSDGSAPEGFKPTDPAALAARVLA
jgi:flagellar biosynthesis GTPase FlhF